VSLEVFADIVATVAGARPVTAALGDPVDDTQAETMAHLFADAGAALVKLGFRGIAEPSRIASLIASAVRGVRRDREHGGVIAVAYADAAVDERVPFLRLIDVAARAGARGVLVDTAAKGGPGLRALIAAHTLASCAAAAHAASLLFAVAGQLNANDVAYAYDAGADIVGVRGAVCEGGRLGRVVADRVHLMRMRCTAGSHMATSPSM
jgi:uncharacterized protein (UPF0264 family)